MLLVKTRIEPSLIHGIGLFADEAIAKGTIIWRCAPGLDLVFDESIRAALPVVARQDFMKYAYLDRDTGKYVLCFDDARFLNHSDEPNIVDGHDNKDGWGIDIAAREIAAGEELTCNYKDFDADFDWKLRR